MEALPGTRGVRRSWECSAWGSWPWDSPRAEDPSLGLPAPAGKGVMEVPWIQGVPDLQDVGSGCPRSPGHPNILPGSSGAAQDPVNPLRLPTPLEQGVAEVPLGSGCPGARGHLPRSSPGAPYPGCLPSSQGLDLGRNKAGWQPELGARLPARPSGLEGVTLRARGAPEVPSPKPALPASTHSHGTGSQAVPDSRSFPSFPFLSPEPVCRRAHLFAWRRRGLFSSPRTINRRFSTTPAASSPSAHPHFHNYRRESLIPAGARAGSSSGAGS